MRATTEAILGKSNRARQLRPPLGCASRSAGPRALPLPFTPARPRDAVQVHPRMTRAAVLNTATPSSYIPNMFGRIVRRGPLRGARRHLSFCRGFMRMRELSTQRLT